MQIDGIQVKKYATNGASVKKRFLDHFKVSEKAVSQHPSSYVSIHERDLNNASDWSRGSNVTDT
jgi:hypothetical protein